MIQHWCTNLEFRWLRWLRKPWLPASTNTKRCLHSLRGWVIWGDVIPWMCCLSIRSILHLISFILAWFHYPIKVCPYRKRLRMDNGHSRTCSGDNNQGSTCRKKCTHLCLFICGCAHQPFCVWLRVVSLHHPILNTHCVKSVNFSELLHLIGWLGLALGVSKYITQWKGIVCASDEALVWGTLSISSHSSLYSSSPLPPLHQAWQHPPTAGGDEPPPGWWQRPETGEKERALRFRGGHTFPLDVQTMERILRVHVDLTSQSKRKLRVF